MIRLGCKMLIYGAVVLTVGVAVAAIGPVGVIGAILVGLALTKKKK